MSDRRFVGLAYVHYARRDRLTFDFATERLWTRWKNKSFEVRRDEVLDFLADYESRDAAVKKWRESTRNKLAGNVLSALRDFGVLTGVVLHLDYDISLGPKLKRNGFQSGPGQASERALRRDESGFLRDEVQGGACFLSPRGGRRGEAWARLQRREVRREFLRPSGRKLVICGRL